jgi:hypothetical protein
MYHHRSPPSELPPPPPPPPATSLLLKLAALKWVSEENPICKATSSDDKQKHGNVELLILLFYWKRALNKLFNSAAGKHEWH